MKTPLLRVMLLSAILSVTIVSVPSCTSEDDVHQKQAEVQGIKADAEKAEADWKLEAEKARRDAAAALAVADKAAEDAANQRVAVAELQATNFRRKIDDAATYLKTMDDALKEPPPQVGGILDTLLPFVPEPYRGGVATISTIGLALWRSNRLKKALMSIPASLVQPNGSGNPIIPEQTFKAHAALIDQKQTPLAKTAVDAVQGASTFAATLFRLNPF